MQLAVVGLGIMGSAMATRLIDKGHTVYVANRTREKASTVLDRGALWCDSPKDAASHADIVITLVTNADALTAVTFDVDGILAGLRPDAVHCDMSTIAPPSAADIERRYREADRLYIQAPVLGSWKQILEGSLLVFAGGQGGNVDKCAPFWESVYC